MTDPENPVPLNEDAPEAQPSGDSASENDAIAAQLTSIGEALDAIREQLAFLPPQVRAVSGKVDQVATTLHEPRYRALLLGMLAIFDLVEQMARMPASDETEHARRYELLKTQLLQLLAINGLTEIPTAGAFDPGLHCAVERVPLEDASMANRILGVSRRGFRTEQSVLRYAEVRVGHYMAADDVPEAARMAAQN